MRSLSQFWFDVSIERMEFIHGMCDVMMSASISLLETADPHDPDVVALALSLDALYECHGWVLESLHGYYGVQGTPLPYPCELASPQARVDPRGPESGSGD